jgi:hypothetical protein
MCNQPSMAAVTTAVGRDQLIEGKGRGSGAVGAGLSQVGPVKRRAA